MFSRPFFRRPLWPLAIALVTPAATMVTSSSGAATGACGARVALASDSRVDSRGSGGAPTTTCIFIHGLDSSKQTWSGCLDAMEAASLPCIAFDLRGHGESVGH